MMPGLLRLWKAALTVALIAAATPAMAAADWPMWRYDAARSANSPEPVPEALNLLWRRQLPPRQPAFHQVRQNRQQFDRGYEPVVAGNTLLLGSPTNDSLVAYDATTGEERWRFYTDGPVRLAPAIWEGKAFAGSDDGHLYCLDLADGRLAWKLRASPSPRKVLGNGRLISVWPVRGAPVLAEAVLYFAAGVWPSEGIFVYAVDAESGTVRWVNDRTGSLYVEHPHGAMAFGGPSPMGYLLIDGGELAVPSGRAFPAYFHRNDGRLVEFAFGHGGHGSRPGSWFLAARSDGRLIVDPEINTEMHDAGQQVIGQRDVRRQKDEVLQEEIQIGTRTYQLSAGVHRTITLGGKTLSFDHPPVPVEGQVQTMLAAGGKLFIVTEDGVLSCYGTHAGEPRIHKPSPVPLPPQEDRWTGEAAAVLKHAKRKAGFALVWGLSDGRLVEELLRQTEYHVIAVDLDPVKVDSLRRRLDAAGLYGERAAVHAGDPTTFGFPPYLAELVVSEDGLGKTEFTPLPDANRGTETSGGNPVLRPSALAKAIVRVLHPFGGAACLATTDEEFAGLEAACRDLDMAGVELRPAGGRAVLVRPGPLPGAKDYAGRENSDERLTAPLELLWFGDTMHHHKLFYKTFYHEAGRGLPTEIAVSRGVMKYASTEEPYGPNLPGVGYQDYLRRLEREKTYVESYTDVYTGRMLSAEEIAGIGFPEMPRSPPPSPGPPPTPASRKNPLTAVVEARAVLKTYGCDRDAVDYGRMLTYRSGTAAFYDKQLESGTINIGGVRSGCRNSIVPAAGVLALPSWTGNCTCNYPVYTSLALTSAPADYEQWSAWGDVAEESPLVRGAINFGAPGDRMAPDGTLWLDWPSVGGPSPRIPLRVEPSDARPFYRHALWTQGGDGPPWVAGSGIVGVRSIAIEPVVRRSEPAGPVISVRWHGSIEPASSETYTLAVETNQGIRLWLGDRLLLDNGKSLRRGETAETTAAIDLQEGRRYPLTLEFYQAPGGPARDAHVRLSWSSPSRAKCVVPAESLLAADGAARGLTGVYYDHPSFSGPAVLRTDPKLDFHWSDGRPEALARPQQLPLPRRSFTVRLYFAEPDDLRPGDRVFSVGLQGKEVIDRLDPVREAGGPRRGIVRQFEDVVVEQLLEIELTPATDQPPLISGIELIAT